MTPDEQRYSSSKYEQGYDTTGDSLGRMLSFFAHGYSGSILREMVRHIANRERLQAQCALIVAIGLQIAVWKINNELLFGPQLLIIATELALAVVIGLGSNIDSIRKIGFHHSFASILLALLSLANIASLGFVLNALIITHVALSGNELLVSAIAIFMTNIIVYALWYWEIDSPGLSGHRWSKQDKDFQFTQHDLKQDYPGWQAEFIDYLYLSVTNAINFAPADARPVTHGAKLLMGSQALVSSFTLALVIARSVSILGS